MVHEAEGHDLAVEDPGHLGVAGAVAAEAGAREDRVADEEDVALALVDLLGHAHVEARLAEPVHVRGALGLALGVLEGGAVRDAVEREPAVGRVYHVGQPGDPVDEVDLEAEAHVGVVEGLPLAHRERRVGRDGGIHPRVDLVDHVEVVGPAHEHALRDGRAAGGRVRGSGDGGGHGAPASCGAPGGAVVEADDVPEPRGDAFRTAWHADHARSPGGHADSARGGGVARTISP